MSTTFTTTLGAARRSSVETIGPSRRRRVRATPGAGAEIAGVAWVIEPLPSFIATPAPMREPEQRLDGASWKTGRLPESPIGSELSNFRQLRKISFLGQD